MSTCPADLTMSISVPRELRLQLEDVRLARARRGRRLPRLRDLIVEALTALVEAEVKTDIAGAKSF